MSAASETVAGAKRALTYALVTPARDEAANLRRLAECVFSQARPPAAWVIVDNGSVDDTVGVGETLARDHSSVRLMRIPAAGRTERGGPPVVAFVAGVDALGPLPDIVVKLDADVSFSHDFFDRLVSRFEEDARLGIASGLCLELDDGVWTPTYSTRSHARGATRAYRRGCFASVSPLEAEVSWDSVDELRARAAGWIVATLPDIPFYHHRKWRTRDGRMRSWFRYGLMSHRLGYRPSYLLMRAGYRMAQDPAAVALVGGYLVAVARRRARHPDENLRYVLRDEQRLRHVRRRYREALGHTGEIDGGDVAVTAHGDPRS